MSVIGGVGYLSLYKEMLEGDEMSLLTHWLESLSYELSATEKCLRKISPFSTCTICQDSCEVQAITYKNGSPIVDHNACNGCGRCITTCPVQSLQGQSPIRNTLNGVLILDGGPLPTETELLHLYKCGIRKISITMPDNKMTGIIDETNELLEKMNMEPFVSVPVPDPAGRDTLPLTRRGLFSKLTFESKKLALTTIAPAKWHFNQDNFRRSNLFEGWSFFTIVLNTESCTLCETCFRLCPGQVFSIQANNLNIDSEKCLGCLLCFDVCRNDAIKVESNVQTSKINTFSIVNSKCKTCGGDFLSWTDEEICKSCESSKKNNILNFL